jgi:hypothetical protein
VMRAAPTPAEDDDLVVEPAPAEAPPPVGATNPQSPFH